MRTSGGNIRNFKLQDSEFTESKSNNGVKFKDDNRDKLPDGNTVTFVIVIIKLLYLCKI